MVVPFIIVHIDSDAWYIHKMSFSKENKSTKTTYNNKDEFHKYDIGWKIAHKTRANVEFQ